MISNHLLRGMILQVAMSESINPWCPWCCSTIGIPATKQEIQIFFRATGRYGSSMDHLFQRRKLKKDSTLR